MTLQITRDHSTLVAGATSTSLARQSVTYSKLESVKSSSKTTTITNEIVFQEILYICVFVYMCVYVSKRKKER